MSVSWPTFKNWLTHQSTEQSSVGSANANISNTNSTNMATSATITTNCASTSVSYSCVHGFIGGNACAVCAIAMTGQGIAQSSGQLTLGGANPATWQGQGSLGSYGGTSISTYWPPTTTMLTPEEQKELKILREQHAAETKALKKLQFKELHPELRQMVIAMLLWNDKSAEIGAASANMSARMMELEGKSFTGTLQSIGTPYGIQYGLIPPPNIPAGLTRQDLEDAHTEATLEEELMNFDPLAESESK